jgi:putative ABC transport system permease protein
MLKNYLKTALTVLRRRPFFTAVSLFGISFTLVVLMVATAMMDHVFAPLPPEVRQDRTLGIYRAKMTGPHSSWNGLPGYATLDKYARNLPGVERMTIATVTGTVYSYLGGNRVKSELRRTDAEYWRVLDFNFVEGGPYTDQDVANGAFVAVINVATRDRFFGGAPAVGRTLEADGQAFRVIGVVPNVPSVRKASSADIWAPLSTAKSDSFKRELIGSCIALLLARSRADFPAIKAELDTRLLAAQLPDPKQYNQLVAEAESFFDSIAGEQFSGRTERKSHPERLWAAILLTMVLFTLLPTVNLVNLNVSRIMERASEIGVRKAFGASSLTLVVQFIVENLLLTLTGGALGLLGSWFVLRALNASDLIPYSAFQLNMRVFAYGLALAVFFGLVSGVYPSWRMSRLNPVQALKGAGR